MQMRIKLFHAPIAALLAVLLASLGCATARRPAEVLPAFQGAPAIQQTSPAKASQPQTPPATTPTAAPILKPAVKPAESTDPVAELIAKVEKEFQSGEDEYGA